LTGLLLLYGLVRLAKARHRGELAAFPLAVAVGRLAPARTALQQRHQDMLRAGSVWEAARALARQCFEAAGIPPGAPGEPPPQVTAAGGWWERWRLRRQVRRLWQLAYGRAPVRVSASEFMRLAAEMERVKVALAGGTRTITP
jgi:hypothetical protein